MGCWEKEKESKHTICFVGYVIGLLIFVGLFRNEKLDRRDVMKKVSKTIPESALFQELAAYEKRIDTYLIQKQMVLQDALNSLTSRVSI